jgi:hypothetical protein
MGNKRSVGSDGGYYDASDYTDADDEKYTTMVKMTATRRRRTTTTTMSVRFRTYRKWLVFTNNSRRAEHVEVRRNTDKSGQGWI